MESLQIWVNSYSRVPNNRIASTKPPFRVACKEGQLDVVELMVKNALDLDTSLALSLIYFGLIIFHVKNVDQCMQPNIVA